MTPATTPTDHGHRHVGPAGSSASGHGRTRSVAIALAALVVTGSAAGLGGALLARDGYETGTGPEVPTQDAIARQWCSNVTPYVGRHHAVRSFRHLAEAAAAGSLDAADAPDPEDADALRRWRAEHPVDATAAYLVRLEGYPPELSVAASVWKLAVRDARAGRQHTTDDEIVLRSGRTLDRFVAASC